MKQIAESHLETEITDAVITVPAYFNNSQRQATKNAGEIAGLNIRIINEPTAAALAYGLGKVSEMKKAKNIVVIDLGGGTFDVSVLRMQNDDDGDNSIDVLGVDGDGHLGGADFTNALMTNIQQEIKTKHNTDISMNKRAMRRVYNACEKAKICSSSHTESFIELDELVPNVDFCTTVSREKFEELCQSLFTRVTEPLESVVKDAKLSKSDIDEVVLVGGSIKIPKIQQLVTTIFDGKAPNKSINPDEAVAYGATIQAAILSGSEEVLDFVLVDVIPMSLGYETQIGDMRFLLKKNTQIPVQHTYTTPPILRTRCHYTKRVFEGERILADENVKLGELKVKTTPGDISSSETTFEVDTNGILTVTYRNLGTGDSKQIEMIRKSSTLTRKEIDTLQKNAKLNQKEDLKEVKRLTEKNKLNSLLVNIRYTLKTNKNLRTLDDQCKEKIQNKWTGVEDWMNSNQGASTEAFKEERSSLLSSWKLTFSSDPTHLTLPGI